MEILPLPQQQLLEAGVSLWSQKKIGIQNVTLHFLLKKKSIHIIDLNKTVEGLQKRETAAH
jgi:small subunit ribosomal protein S2